ncbi:MAG TPA: bifunctional riboflavin kinase/FAD synthetase [Xanthobacteraceae bacterium]|jgi:riboflavin kinase/FMN adenylyltransferase|nr:bifunctional riboflavin kinase/FAD synthetase [Xanthobacteraceae bacterium]
MAANTFSVVRDFATDAGLRGAVVAIGNFDGVHRGHKAVIAAAQQRAATLGRPAAALTFEPHPRTFFNPGEPLFRLTDAAAKLRLLAAAGLDGAIVLTFDDALAQLTAEAFVTRILVERFAVSGAAIGFNFHFGANRAGSPGILASEGAKRGFTVDIVPPLRDRGRPVSSQPIREALAAGRLDEAAELLGYPWFISGPVVHGDKRGRELGFPTANLVPDPACGLRRGIYAVRVGLHGRHYDGVASFGRRPMYDVGTVLLETFLFDFSGDLYGATIDVAFIAFIRDEATFASAGELVRQMQDDSRVAREALSRAGGAFPPI